MIRICRICGKREWLNGTARQRLDYEGKKAQLSQLEKYQLRLCLAR